MTRQESTILLSIGQTQEEAPVFVSHLLLDGQVVVSNRSLSTQESRGVQDFSRRYNAMFEQQNRQPRIGADNLRALGAELFTLWLAPAWTEVVAKVQVGAQRTLVIASDVPAVLNLPWELLHPPDSDFLGFDPKFSIRRLPRLSRELAPSPGPLPPRPLRILFMACAPQDQPPLDYEREEEFLLRAIAKAGPNVAFDSGDLGTFEELRERINEFQPHVVHVTGHGIVKDDGLGHFAFEDERG